MDGKYGYYDWNDNNNKFESFLEKLEDALQWIYNHSINLYLDKKKRKVQIKLHEYDTWGTYHDLSLIILPLLKKLKENKQGTPFTDDSDVPENLKSTSAPPRKNEWDTDGNFEKRWDWIMEEIIWSFEQVADENSDDRFFKGNEFNKEGYEKWNARVSNGLILFGKYFRSLWT